MHVNLHLTDDTQLHAHGYVVDGSRLFAEVQWDFPVPGTRIGNGALWGTPAAMRRLAALATQAAIQAEEEAAWQARATTTTAAAWRQGQVA
jgi:hypothetical protein